jgi:preprotein translocase subunit YajC
MTVAFLAQAASAQGCMQVATLPLLMVGIFYLLVWRPQQKQLEEARKFRDSLKSDDNVITAGGIYGRITDVDEESVRIEVSRGVKIRVARTQIVKHQASTASDSSDTSESTEKSKK